MRVADRHVVEPRRTEPVSRGRRGRTPASDRAVRFATIRAYAVGVGDDERAAWLQRAGHLLDYGGGIGRMVQNHVREHRVRFTILQGQTIGFTATWFERPAAKPLRHSGEHAVGVVNADHGRACIERGFGDEACAGADVGHHEARTHAGRLNRGLRTPSPKKVLRMSSHLSAT